MDVPESFRAYRSGGEESPAYWLVDILWVIHASGEQTEGRYSVIEQWMPPVSGPPPHVHPIDEAFYVMEGEMTLMAGGETLVLREGSMGHVPRGTVHSFEVTGEGTCHVLNWYTPAGFEEAIAGCARPAEERALPPKGLDPPDSPQVYNFIGNYWSAPAQWPWAVRKPGGGAEG